jgi:hypothetical protein
MIAPNLILTGGALAYVRSATARRRALVLADALAVAWMGTTIGNAVYWHGRQMPWMARPSTWEATRPTLVALFVLVAFLLAPSLLVLLHRFVRGNRPLGG